MLAAFKRTQYRRKTADMAEMDEKLRKMADEALTKSGADVTISKDGTVSGSPIEYFKFLDAFIPEGAANDPI